MLVDSELESSGDLALTAYTVDPSELRALEKVLERAGVYASGTSAPPDAANRPATKYVVPKKLIRALGLKIGGRFSQSGEFQPRPGGKRPFACERVDLIGVSGDCRTLHADDMAAARVQCALLARNLQWFGGIPRNGRCP
jgi:hypothetical protein